MLAPKIRWNIFRKFFPGTAFRTAVKPLAVIILDTNSPVKQYTISEKP